MKYWVGVLGGAATAVAVNILLVMRAMNDTSNPNAGENAMGYAFVPLAAILSAAVGVIVVMIWSGIKGQERAT